MISERGGSAERGGNWTVASSLASVFMPHVSFVHRSGLASIVVGVGTAGFAGEACMFAFFYSCFVILCICTHFLFVVVACMQIYIGATWVHLCVSKQYPGPCVHKNVFWMKIGRESESRTRIKWRKTVLGVARAGIARADVAAAEPCSVPTLVEKMWQAYKRPQTKMVENRGGGGSCGRGAAQT